MIARRAAFGFTAILLSQLCVGGLAAAQEPEAGAAPAAPPAADAPRLEPPPAAPAVAPAVPPEAMPSMPAAPAKGKKKTASEEIVVTGSRIRRKDVSTPAPVAVISREQLQASGIASIGDFLQQMPAQGGGTNTNVNNAGDGETQVSLRNLGASRTLVLVDGKRWVKGGSGAGFAVDMNSIPTAAIERIEILKDGASAVYGSDAIGGVVNIITRRRTDGSEASIYSGMTTHGDANQTDINVSTGVSSDKGNFFVGAGYFDQQGMLAGNRDWAKNALNYDYSTGEAKNGGSGTIPQGRVQIDPSTCTTPVCQALNAKYGPGKIYVMYDPTNPDSVSGWRKYNTPADTYNYQPINLLITPSSRISLFTNGDYKFSDYGRAYVQASFVNRQSKNLIAPAPFSTANYGLTVSVDNQFNPFGIDLSNVGRRLVESGGRSQGFDLDTVRTVVGIDGTLPESLGPLRGLFWDLSFNYGRTSGVTTTSGSLNTQMSGNGVGPSYQDADGKWQCGTAATGPIANCTPVNLFGGPGTITPDMLAALGGYQGINMGWTQMTAVQFNVNHELVKLGSDRPMAIAAGYEFRSENGGYIPNAIAQAGNDSDYNGLPTQGMFHVNEAYAELVVPIVSNVFLLDDLEADLAGRFFAYNTFGSGATYKLGGRWRPIRDLTLRGTYSTGFRAPDVSDLYGGAGPSFEAASDPCGKIPAGNAALLAQCQNGPGGSAGAANNGDDSTQIASTVGGNPNLKPETAVTQTLGIVIEPTVVKNLAITVDYYNVALSKNLGFNTTPVILSGCYPAAAGSDAAPNQEFCNMISRNPATGMIQNVQDLETNVGTTNTSGIDLAGRYSVPSDYGRFTALFDSTYLLEYKWTVASGKLYSAAGNYDLGSGLAGGGLTPRVKFNAGLNYAKDSFTAGLQGRFIGGFDECAAPDGTNTAGLCGDNNLEVDGMPAPGEPFPVHHVPAQMTFDLQASYALKTPAGTTSLTAGARNLLDTAPPRVYNSFLTYADTSYDFAGRFVYVRLAQKF